jgi:prefoldin alpha subunit
MQNQQNRNVLAYQFQYLREQKDMYEQNLEIINASLGNLQNTKKTIENLKDVESGEEILIPIGGIVNLKGSIKNPEKILLSVSDDVIIEKSIEGSIEFIDKIIEQHKQQINFIQEQLQKVEANLQSISQAFQQGMPQS